MKATEVELKNVRYYEIQSLVKVPGYLMTFYSNSPVDIKNKKISVGFSIKDSDLDILIEKLKTSNIPRQE